MSAKAQNTVNVTRDWSFKTQLSGTGSYRPYFNTPKLCAHELEPIQRVATSNLKPAKSKQSKSGNIYICIHTHRQVQKLIIIACNAQYKLALDCQEVYAPMYT